MQADKYRDLIRNLLVVYFAEPVSETVEGRARVRLQEFLVPVRAVRFLDYGITRVHMQDGSVANYGEGFSDY